jgi:hypothetical protein
LAAIATTQNGNFRRSETAQATTGQTDWINVPEYAKYAFVFLNITATAGTTPLTDISFLAADPVSRDDAHVIKLAEHADLTDADGTAAQFIYQLGPGVTGIADDVTAAAAADSVVSLNVVLPPLLGIKIHNDRTGTNETYTYNLSVTFRK